MFQLLFNFIKLFFKMKTRILLAQYLMVALFVTLFAACVPAVDEPTKIEETTIFTTKYTKDKVWDAQRSPAYPVASQDWVLSGLKGALDLNRVTIDWGIGRYLMFVAEEDKANATTSLTDDLYSIGTKYKMVLKLYESNGTLVKVISNWGEVIGIGDKGFMYVAEGQIGMFFPVVSVTAGGTVTYRPTTLKVTKLSQLYK
jgi:hypothetical protein